MSEEEENKLSLTYKDLGIVALKESITDTGLSVSSLLQDEIHEELEKFIDSKITKEDDFKIEELFPQIKLQSQIDQSREKELIKVTDVLRDIISSVASHSSHQIEAQFDGIYSNNLVLEYERPVVLELTDYTKRFFHTQDVNSVFLKAFQFDSKKYSSTKEESIMSHITKMIENEGADDEDEDEVKKDIGRELTFLSVLSSQKNTEAMPLGQVLKFLEKIHENLLTKQPGSIFGINLKSFIIDQHFTALRNIFHNIINGVIPKSNSSDLAKRVLEKSMQCMLLAGIIRYSIEDLLLVFKLIEKFKLQVNLKDELLMIDPAKIPSKLKSLDIEFASSRMIVTKGVPLTNLGDYFYRIKIQANASIATDGKFVYIHQASIGLVKIGTGNKGTLLGKIYMHLPDYRKQEVVNIFHFKSRLYIRSSSMDPLRPVVQLNKLSLEEIENKSPEDHLHPLAWKEKDYSGRSLKETPIFSDGAYLYLISLRQGAGTKRIVGAGGLQELLMLEAIDIQDNKFVLVREIPITQNEKSFMDLQPENTYIINEDYVISEDLTKRYTIRLDTGKVEKVESLDESEQNRKMVLDPINKIFYSFDISPKEFDYIKILEHNDFATSGENFFFELFRKQLFEAKESLMSIGKSDDMDDAKAPGQTRLLVKQGTMARKMNEEEESKEQFVQITPQIMKHQKFYLIGQLYSASLQFDKYLLTIQSNKTASDEEKIALFKFPYTSYPSPSLFLELIQMIEDSANHILSQKLTGSNLQLQYELLFLIKILKCNMQVIQKGKILLNSVLEEMDFKKFMKFFDNCLKSLAQQSADIEVSDEDFKEEILYIWNRINQNCSIIIDLSLYYLYGDVNKALEKAVLAMKSSQDDTTSERELGALLAYLNEPIQAGLFFDQQAQIINDVKEVYKMCILKQKDSIKAFMQKSLLAYLVDTLSSRFSIESRRFIQTYNEQLIFHLLEINQKKDLQKSLGPDIIQSRLEELFECFEYQVQMFLLFQVQMNKSLKQRIGPEENLQNEWFSKNSKKYFAFVNQMEQFFTNDSGFYTLLCLHIHHFSILELNSKQKRRIHEQFSLLLQKISEYYKTINFIIVKFGSKINDRDNFKQQMDKFSRKIALFIGRFGFQLMTSSQITNQLDTKKNYKDMPLETRKYNENLHEHPIQIASPADRFTYNENLKNQFICDVCKASFGSEASYSCLKCDYHVCKNCFLEHFANIKNISKHAHTVYKTTHPQRVKTNSAYSGGANCDICKAKLKYTDSHSCLPCCSDFCDGCWEKYKIEDINKKQIQEERKESSLISEDLSEKYKQMIIDSKLLFGGLEQKHLGTLSQTTIRNAENLVFMTKNEFIKDLFEQSKIHQGFDKDNIYVQIIEGTPNPNILKIISHFQEKAEKEGIDYATTEKEMGQTVARITFAVLLKFQIEDLKLKEFIQLVASKGVQSLTGQLYEQIYEQYKAALLMKRWLGTSRKQKLNALLYEKMEEQKKTEPIFLIQNKTMEEIKQFREKKEILRQEASSQIQNQLTGILENLKLKALILVKVQVSPVKLSKLVNDGKQIKNDQGYNSLKHIKDAEKFFEEIELIELPETIKKEFYESIYAFPVNSILTIMQLPIRANQLHNLINEMVTFQLNKVTGLQLLTNTLSYELSQKTELDLLTSLLSGMKFSPDVIDFGNQSENQLSILHTFLEGLTFAYDEKYIIQILQILQEMISNQSMQELMDLNPLLFIHQEDKRKLNFITLLWGYEKNQKYQNQDQDLDENEQIRKYISSELLSILEKILYKTLHLAQFPELENIDNKLTLKTLEKSFNIIVFEIERYLNSIQAKLNLGQGKMQGPTRLESSTSQIQEMQKKGESNKPPNSRELPNLQKPSSSVLGVDTNFLKSNYSEVFIQRIMSLLQNLASTMLSSQNIKDFFIQIDMQPIITILLNIVITSPPKIKQTALVILNNLFVAGISNTILQNGYQTAEAENGLFGDLIIQSEGIENLGDFGLVQFFYIYALQILRNQYTNNIESKGYFIVWHYLCQSLRVILHEAPQKDLKEPLIQKIRSVLTKPYNFEKSTYTEICELNLVLNLFPEGYLVDLHSGSAIKADNQYEATLLGFVPVEFKDKSCSTLTYEQLATLPINNYLTSAEDIAVCHLTKSKGSLTEQIKFFEVSSLSMEIKQFQNPIKAVFYEDKALINLLEIIMQTQSNKSFSRLGLAKFQALKILSSEGVMRGVKEENILARIDKLGKHADLQKVLERKVEEEKHIDIGQNLSSSILEIQLQKYMQLSIISNFSFKEDLEYPLKAVLKSNKSILFKQEQDDAMKNFDLEYSFESSGIEQKKYPHLDNMCISVDFLSEIIDKIKKNHSPPGFIIILSDQIIEENKEALRKIYQQVQGIISSSDNPRFAEQLHSLIKDENITKDKKPFIYLIPDELQKIKDRNKVLKTEVMDNQPLEEKENGEQELSQEELQKKESQRDIQQEAQRSIQSAERLKRRATILKHDDIEEQEQPFEEALDITKIISETLIEYKKSEKERKLNINEMFTLLPRFDQDVHEQNITELQFRKNYIQTLERLIYRYEIDLLLKLYFSNNSSLIMGLEMKGQTSPLTKTLNLIYLDCIYYSNLEAVDKMPIKQFREVFKSYVKEPNFESIAISLAKYLITSLPLVCNKIKQDSDYFVNEEYNQKYYQIPHPKLLTIIASILINNCPWILFGKTKDGSLIRKGVFHRVIYGLFNLMFSTANKNSQILQTPFSILFKILNLMNYASRNIGQNLDELIPLVKSRFIDNLKEKKPKGKSSSSRECLQILKEIFYYYTRIQIELMQKHQLSWIIISGRNYEFYSKVESLIQRDIALAFKTCKSSQNGFLLQLQKSIKQISSNYNNTSEGFLVPFVAKLRAVPNSEAISFMFQQIMNLKDNHYFTFWTDKELMNKIVTVDLSNYRKEYTIPFKEEIYLTFSPSFLNYVYGFGDNQFSQLGIDLQCDQDSSDLLTVAKNIKIQSIASWGQLSVIHKEDGNLLATGKLEQTGDKNAFQSSKFIPIDYVKYYSVASKSLALVRNDNSIIIMGDSQNDKHFSTAIKLPKTEFFLQKCPDIKSDIVGISSGYDFSIVITLNNEIFEIRNNQNPRIASDNQEELSQSYVSKLVMKEYEEKNEKMHLANVWCSKSQTEQCIFIEIAFEDQNQKNIILSQGKSSCGLLGQMNENESSQFNKIAFDFSRSTFTKLSVGSDSAIGITSNNELFGWGSTQDGKILLQGQQINRPTIIPFLDRKTNRLIDVSAGSSFSLVSVETHTLEHKIYLLGGTQKLLQPHYDMSEIVQVQPNLHQFTITDFEHCTFICAGQESGFIVNKVQIDESKSFYENFVTTEVRQGENIQGIMHFCNQNASKGIDNHQNEDWEFKAGKLRYNEFPDISLAIKHQVDNFHTMYKEYFKIILDAHKCLDYDSQIDENKELGLTCSETGKRIRGTYYYAQYEIAEGLTTEIYLSEEAFMGPTQFDFIPMMYYRLKRPLKKGARLPLIDLQRFFENSRSYQFSLDIFSNLTFSHDITSIKSLVRTNTLHQFKEYYENPSSIYNDMELLSKVQEYLKYTSEPTSKIKTILIEKQEQIIPYFKGQNISEEIKNILKDMDFLNLQNYDKVSKVMFQLITFYELLNSLTQKIHNRQITSNENEELQVHTMKMIQDMPLSLKQELIDSKFKKPSSETQTWPFKKDNLIDSTGKKSFLNFAIKEFKSNLKLETIFFNNNDEKDPGVKIEYWPLSPQQNHMLFMTEIFKELSESSIFIPSPNSLEKRGDNQYKYILNPKAPTPNEAETLLFLGKLIGKAVRCKETLPLEIASIFFKQLLQQDRFKSLDEKLEDIKTFYIIAYERIQDLRQKAETLSKSEFDSLKSRNSIRLSNGAFKKNPVGGEFVTKESFQEFLVFAVNGYLQESQSSIQIILRGIQSVFDTQILSYYHWSQLQHCVIGEDEIGANNLLSKFTFNAHPVLGQFYDRFYHAVRALNNFQLKQLMMLVFGRTRLCSKFQPTSIIVLHRFNDENYLPISKRNLFMISLPMYPTQEECIGGIGVGISYFKIINS